LAGNELEKNHGRRKLGEKGGRIINASYNRTDGAKRKKKEKRCREGGALMPAKRDVAAKST